MPYTQISMRKGKTTDYRKEIMKQVYLAMRDSFNVPEDDYFMSVLEFDDVNLTFGRNYMDIERSDEFMIIQITANNTRTVELKKELYKYIAGRLKSSLGVRPEDVFINLVEVDKENWSFGNGVAQLS